MAGQSSGQSSPKSQPERMATPANVAILQQVDQQRTDPGGVKPATSLLLEVAKGPPDEESGTTEGLRGARGSSACGSTDGSGSQSKHQLVHEKYSWGWWKQATGHVDNDPACIIIFKWVLIILGAVMLGVVVVVMVEVIYAYFSGQLAQQHLIARINLTSTTTQPPSDPARNVSLA